MAHVYLPNHMYICAQFSAEVERLFGMGLDLKFLEVVPIVIKHGRNAEARTAVQDVAKQWDNELEGE